MDQFKITELGDYRTRNGARVTVFDLGGKGTASVRGSVWRMFRGKMCPKGFDIWQPNGMFGFVGTSDMDIVGVWQDK